MLTCHLEHTASLTHSCENSEYYFLKLTKQVPIKEIIEPYISLSTAARSGGQAVPLTSLAMYWKYQQITQWSKHIRWPDNCLLSISTDLLGLIGSHKFHSIKRSGEMTSVWWYGTHPSNLRDGFRGQGDQLPEKHLVLKRTWICFSSFHIHLSQQKKKKNAASSKCSSKLHGLARAYCSHYLNSLNSTFTLITCGKDPSQNKKLGFMALFHSMSSFT